MLEPETGERRCGEVQHIAGKRWVCFRPPHAHPQPYYSYDGKYVMCVIDQTDKHWMRREEET